MPLKTGRYAPTTGNPSRLILRVERLTQPTAEGDTLSVSGDCLKGGKLHSFLSMPKSGNPAVRELVENGKRVLEADLFFGMHNYEVGRRGTLRVAFDSDREGQARLKCPAQSVAVDLSLRLRWQDRYFRDLTIEMDKIADAEFPDSTRQDGVTWTLGKLFRDTGFKTRIVKSQRRLTDETDGWTAGELHQAMEDNRRDLGSWSTYVFLTSFVIDEDGQEDFDTMGWMYDVAEDDRNWVPREACAVFDDAVRAYTRDFFGRLTARRYHRELIMTTAHEIGHACNLSHSFNKGRSDSNSLMNYPDQYEFGENEYYEDLEYTFDREELTHLRHHSPLLVEPGREGGEDFRFEDPFRRATEGSGDAACTKRGLALRDELELRLHLPTDRVLPGEPLALTVGLGRRSWAGKAASFRVGTQLAWATDRLKFAVRRRGERAWSILDAPIRQCRAKREVQLQRGKARTSTVELLISRKGEIFQRPGDYELCALLAVGKRDASAIVRSRVARLRVAAPRTAEEKWLRGLYKTRGLKRLLLMPGAAVPDDARGAAEELHARVPQRLSAQLATMALIREAKSYDRGRAKKAVKRFLDRSYVDHCRNEIASQTVPGKLFERKLRGLVRTARDVKKRTR